MEEGVLHSDHPGHVQSACVCSLQGTTHFGRQRWGILRCKVQEDRGSTCSVHALHTDPIQLCPADECLMTRARS